MHFSKPAFTPTAEDLERLREAVGATEYHSFPLREFAWQFKWEGGGHAAIACNEAHPFNFERAKNHLLEVRGTEFLVIDEETGESTPLSGYPFADLSQLLEGLNKI